MSSRPTELTAFNKAGTAVTDANGIAYVVFRTPVPYGFDYVVSLTCTASLRTAYVTNKTANGFTITTWNTTVAGGGAAVGSSTVYWIARSAYNE